MKLSLDEREELRELLLADGYSVLLKLIRSGIEPLNVAVLECDLSTSTPDELIHRKLRAEGAAQYIRALVSSLETIKRPHGSKDKKS